MAIQFNEIPLDIRTPGVYVEFDGSRAVQGVAQQEHSALVVGQLLSGGSAAAGTPYLVRSADEAKALFGTKSQLAQMCAAYKAQDSLTPLWAIGIADSGSGVDATGSFAYSGTATEAGSIPHYIGGRRVVVTVPSGMSAAQLEVAFLASAALHSDLPVTLEADDEGDAVDLTAVNAGTVGNQIQLGVCLQPGERVPAGLTVTVTAMSGGGTDPDYADIVTAMADSQYHTVAIGAADNTNVGLIRDELDSRWEAMVAEEGVGFFARLDSQGDLTTMGNDFNSPSMVAVGAEESALVPLPWEIAAGVAALSAKQAKIDPAVAMVGYVLRGSKAAPRGSRFTRSERDTLLRDGVTTLRATSDGRLAIDRAISTYQTNGLGLADTAYLDLYRVRTLYALRYSVRVRSSKFTNFKLADDGNEIAGQNILTPAIFKSEMLALFTDWQQLGWVENYPQFAEELLVERDGSDDNRLNVILPPDIINAFLVGALQIQFRQ